MTRVAIAGSAAISRFGATARGLGRALIDETPLPGVPAETPLANPRARNVRKMMSRGAYLAAAALGDLMREVGWVAEQREGAGYFLGVGASGGSLDDVSALLDASIVGDAGNVGASSTGASSTAAFSTAAFGDRGLAACNPLLAFQLMNNFTLAHGAILEGLGGPNGALFSRGSGTTAALIEAVHAIASGDCDRAIAGGADSATHPVTVAELAREDFVRRGLLASEGAGLLALVCANAKANARPEIVIAGCAIASSRGRSLTAAISDAAERALAMSASPTSVDVIVVAAWGPPAVDAIASWARTRFPSARLVDTTALGATLAAGPALGWIAAVDLLETTAQRALVIDAGVDGDAGAVLFERERVPEVEGEPVEREPGEGDS